MMPQGNIVDAGTALAVPQMFGGRKPGRTTS